MKKTFHLTIEGKHPDRVLDAVKHEIRKYQRRERRRPLAEGVDFLDFDCRFGRSAETAEVVPLAALIGLVDAAARDGAPSVYVELLAKPGHRTPRPATPADSPDAPHGTPDPGDGTAPHADAGFPETVLAPRDSEFPPTQLFEADSDDPK